MDFGLLLFLGFLLFGLFVLVYFLCLFWLVWFVLVCFLCVVLLSLFCGNCPLPQSHNNPKSRSASGLPTSPKSGELKVGR